MGAKFVIHPAGGLPPCTDADHKFCTIIVFRARYVIYLYNIYIYIYIYIYIIYIHVYIHICYTSFFWSMSKSLSFAKQQILTKTLLVPRPMVTSYGRLKFPNHPKHYNSVCFSMIWNSSPDEPDLPAVPEVSHLLPFGTSSTRAGGQDDVSSNQLPQTNIHSPNSVCLRGS